MDKNSINPDHIKDNGDLNEIERIKKQLSNALQIAKLGVWEWDILNDYLSVSDEVYKKFKTNREDFPSSMDCFVKEIVHKESKESFQKALDMALNKGIILNGVYRVIHPEKPVCYIKLKSNFELDKDGNSGKVLKVFGVLMDVTEDYLSEKTLNEDRDFLKILMNSIPNPIFYKNSEGLYTHFNQAFMDSLGLEKDDIENKTVYDIAPKELADVYNKSDNEMIAKKGNQTYESVVLYSDGLLHDVILTKSAHLDSQGNVLGIVGIMQDVTDNKKMEKRLKMINKAKEVFLKLNHSIINYQDEKTFLDDVLINLQPFFGHSEQATVLKVGEDGMLSIFASYGYPKEEAEKFQLNLQESLIGKVAEGNFEKPYIINNIGSKDREFSEPIIENINKNKIRSSLSIPITRHNKVKWILSFDSIKNKAFNNDDLVVAEHILEELTLIYRVFRLYQKTLFMARYDGLTGLMNRTYFNSCLDDDLTRAEANKKQLKVVMFDLDGLKKINDSLGHRIGDKYLIRFSQMLKQYFPENCYFSRLGGDEFAGVFLGDVENNVADRLEQLRNEFQETEYSAGDVKFKGGVSYGIATYPESAVELRKLMKLADEKMYEYKTKNR